MENMSKKFEQKTRLRLRKSLISLVCVFALAVSMFSALQPTNVEASAANFTQDQAVTWIKAQEGKSHINGNPNGAQCVELIKSYYAYLGVTVANGNAADYNTSTAPRCPTGWTRVTSNPQPGDVVVWPVNSTWGSYGHIGLITSVSGTSFTTVEQNVDGTPSKGGPGRVKNRSTTGTTAPVCYLRPNFKETFTVKYNANGGSGSMADTIVTYGVNVSLRANTFTRSGYGFDGWTVRRGSDGKWRYMNAAGEDQWCTEGTQPSGYSKYVYKDQGTVGKTVPRGDTATMYAQWTDKFTVKYNANGGSGTMADTIVTYGVNVSLRANAFTRSGYVFDGWNVRRGSDGKWRYMNAAGEEQWCTEGTQPSGYSKYVYKNQGTVGKTVPRGDTATMYAIWKK